jgi:hypothetical protein
MNFFKGLLMLTLLTASVAGQIEHAPTVEQCQADQRLWFSKIESHPIDGNLPDIRMLTQWSRGMLDCEEVDPQHHWQYYNVQAEIGFLEAMRYEHFLDRHGMWDKFLAEDAAGKR